MKDSEDKPIVQKILDQYREEKELGGYPFLSWSGTIIGWLAYLSLVGTGVMIFRFFSKASSLLGSEEKFLYAFISVIAGIVVFILLKGLSSACFLLLDLWKRKS